MAALSAPPDALVAAAVTFDAFGSSDIQAAITSYTFDFGDGSPTVVQAEARATHTYDQAGAFRATVTVRDPRGAVAAASVDVVIGMQLSAPITLQHSSFEEEGARIALEAGGAIDVAYEYANHLMFTRSTDTGANFSTPVIAAAGNARFESAQLAMATTGKGPAVHIVATRFDTATGGAEVAYVKSTAGAAFSAPALVSQNDGVNSLVPAIATDGDHRVFVAWEDSPVNGGDAVIWFALSDDEGASFSAPVALGKASAAAGSSLGCPNLARGKDQDVLLLWLQGPDFHGQFYLARSTDSGQSFAAPVQLFARTDRLWCPQLLADTSGRLLLIWAEGDAWGTRMFRSRSLDSGATWSEPALLLPNVEDVVCATAALRADGELTLVFSTASDPFLSAPYSTFVRLSSDAGATFGPALPARVVSDQSACPALAMPAPGRIALVWNTLVRDGPTFAADLHFSGGPVSMP